MTDPKIATRAALRALFPLLTERRDWTLKTDGTIDEWTAPARFVRPTTEQLAAKVAELAAQQAAAAARKSISPAAFIARIPTATWAKVQVARENNPALDQGLYRLAAGQTVENDNPDLLAMLAQLVAANVITDAERTQIIGF